METTTTPTPTPPCVGDPWCAAPKHRPGCDAAFTYHGIAWHTVDVNAPWVGPPRGADRLPPAPLTRADDQDFEPPPPDDVDIDYGFADARDTRHESWFERTGEQ